MYNNPGEDLTWSPELEEFGILKEKYKHAANCDKIN